MSIEALKTTSITNLDATPMVANTAGEGAGQALLVQTEYITVSAAASTTSTYRMIRVPTNAKVKSLVVESEAMGGGNVNLSVYYSDAYATDGSPPTQAGAIVGGSPGGNAFFASDIDLTSAIVGTQIINESGTNTLNLRNTALWSALGLTADPGGFFDLVYVVHTNAITTGAARLGLRAEYTV